MGFCMLREEGVCLFVGFLCLEFLVTFSRFNVTYSSEFYREKLGNIEKHGWMRKVVCFLKATLSTIA